MTFFYLFKSVTLQIMSMIVLCIHKKNSKQEKVLGVTIDKKLNFEMHLSNITKNANIKFNALTRVQKYMITDQKNVYSLLLLNLSSLIAL